MKYLKDFEKQRDILICVDSDGCAMDTMDIKHFNCFGPCMVEEWELYPMREDVLRRWNEINLYTMTRGINRFKGLSLALSEIDEKYTPVRGIEELCRWTDTAPELSNGALEAMIEDNPSDEIFKKALSWSRAVNSAIDRLPEEGKLPFPLVREALELAHRHADVAIVSSANIGAVLDEWRMHRLLDHVDVVTSQNDGSKAHCIDSLLSLGYNNINVVMCGDAPGDLAAAKKCGVFFYPILVGREGESWDRFMTDALPRLINGRLDAAYQDMLIEEFNNNLNK